MNSEENSLLNNAVAKLHIEDYYAAKLLVKVVLKKNSKSFNALNLMGVLEGIEGNHFDASIYFKKALKLKKVFYLNKGWKIRNWKFKLRIFGFAKKDGLIV